MAQQDFSHRFVHTNGLRMHLTEAGSGPLVVFCHGFPELGYCWRHQIRALAANIDRRWRQTRFLAGARWVQPTLFIAGDVDKVFELRRTAYERLEEAIPNLRHKVLLAGAGHWLQQERPQEVNRLLLSFLSELDKK